MLLRYLCPTIILIAVSTDPGAAQGDSTISPHGIAGVRLCQPLADVRERFPSARDTIVEGEGEKWPAKVVLLGDARRVLFEASWADASHIWTISTNSPRYRTPRGYRVGMTLGDLRDKNEQLEFSYPEGRIVVKLVSDHVYFLPDDSTARAFLRRSPLAFDSLTALPRSARINELFVNGDCPL